MAIEIPEAVQWLTPIVVGASWPEGDEDKLRAMRDAWKAAAQAVEEVLGDGNGASSAALGCMSGQTAEKFKEHWQKFGEGGDAYLVSLEQLCTDLAEGCNDAALGIEYTKMSIIIALSILLAQIIAMIASAVATFGASTAGVPIAQAATRITVQSLFQQLLKQIVVNLAINVGSDVAIQALQFAKGDRQSWDFGKTVDAGIAGVAAGVASGGVGAVSGAIGGTTSNFVQAATRGAVEGAVSGAAGNVLTNVAHGKVSLEDFGTAIVSGATSGSVGGAIGGMSQRHAGLVDTWGNTTSPDGQYTSGANTQGHTFTTRDGATVQANIPNNPHQGGVFSSGGEAGMHNAGGQIGPNNVNDPHDSDYRVKSSANPPQMVGRLDLPDPPPPPPPPKK
ncbi:hypothetical protein JNUCC0626_27830 [Lentzea sp. JNUCC 0626]|uniref:WXG100-like domain-containing protein n=1 Tax=Lentzea sp. JNUCC 0626 TaxID=3367513 RepID=UPI003749DF5B